MTFFKYRELSQIYSRKKLYFSLICVFYIFNYFYKVVIEILFRLPDKTLS